MSEVDSTLWEIEKQLWLGGVDLYRQYLTDHSLMVFPGMVLPKAQTVESIASGPRWSSVTFTDQQVVHLVADAIALVYRASASRARREAPYSALVSSVYVRRGGDWRLALHQQTPDSGMT